MTEETKKPTAKKAAKKVTKKVTKKAAPKKAAPAKKVTAKKAVSIKRPEKATLKNGDKSARPAKGTQTGKVWTIADKNFRKDRKAIIAACVAAGINPATASTQYGYWRRERIAEGLQVGPAKKANKAKAA